ncbi:hypothetical protein [Bacillus sp. S0628]|uniref:hypothetical protein n=1 Tax=Bacillus sp. S0628 TaxID=2957802 RepID=UPI00209D3ACB|nr:hypothetical protein [Bacillus sp. S0628]MCP1324265.1 hypothetical protein [Bacillus sp. S0628]
MTTKYLGEGIWARRTNIDASDIMMPVDLQSHHQETIQTHNNVVVAPTTWNNGAWIDTSGFNEVAITMSNNASTKNKVNVHWSHDGVNSHGDESILEEGTSASRAGIVATKARYFRVCLNNGDVAPHNMSAWVYLKA